MPAIREPDAPRSKARLAAISRRLRAKRGSTAYDEEPNSRNRARRRGISNYTPYRIRE